MSVGKIRAIAKQVFLQLIGLSGYDVVLGSADTLDWNTAGGATAISLSGAAGTVTLTEPTALAGLVAGCVRRTAVTPTSGSTPVDLELFWPVGATRIACTGLITSDITLSAGGLNIGTITTTNLVADSGTLTGGFLSAGNEIDASYWAPATMSLTVTAANDTTLRISPVGGDWAGSAGGITFLSTYLVSEIPQA